MKLSEACARISGVRCSGVKVTFSRKKVRSGESLDGLIPTVTLEYTTTGKTVRHVMRDFGDVKHFEVGVPGRPKLTVDVLRTAGVGYAWMKIPEVRKYVRWVEARINLAAKVAVKKATVRRKAEIEAVQRRANKATYVDNLKSFFGSHSFSSRFGGIMLKEADVVRAWREHVSEQKVREVHES